MAYKKVTYSIDLRYEIKKESKLRLNKHLILVF